MSSRGADLFVGLEAGYIIVINSLMCTCLSVLPLYSDEVLYIMPQSAGLKLDDTYQVISYGIGFRHLYRPQQSDKSNEYADIICWEGGKW